MRRTVRRNVAGLHGICHSRSRERPSHSVLRQLCGFDAISAFRARGLVNNCQEKAKLSAAYQNAADAYSKVVDETAVQLGTLNGLQLQELKFMACMIERVYLRARSRLDEHIAEHKC